ncbi:MAG: hypothetical protein IBJ11_08395 [Phycisphaerales bacterium]|nr:hypothetical protein [Phycisphaerales bacterium]
MMQKNLAKNPMVHAAAWCLVWLVCVAAPGLAWAQCGGRWLSGPQQITPGFDGPVYAYAVMPNGDVVAGGVFTSVGGVAASSIARWDGTTWSAMGFIGTRVNALVLDQNGNLIAATGEDANSGGSGAVFRWNGSSWSQLGGDTGSSGGIMALAIASNGDIIAGGRFSGIGWFGSSGGIQANCIARWNGSAWSPLGSAVPPNYLIPGLANPPASPPAAVYAITVLANGDIIAGGQFLVGTNATGTVLAQNIARWNGSAWSAIGPGLRGGVSTVRALGVLSNGQIVAAGGFFLGTTGIQISNIATWNGASWLPVGTGGEDPDAGATTIYALRTQPGGGVIIGGDFGNWAGQNANRVARWNGSAWSTYGSGVDAAVRALAVRTNGELMVGGDFSAAGGTAANRAARWNVSAWSSIASGLGLSNAVTAFATMPNGDIVAAGPFTAANGVAINVSTDGTAWPGGVARWNGASWSPLPPLAPINALAVASNGDLIAGGSFGGGVARLSGSTWSALVGGGVDGPVNAIVRMPSGDIIVGGSFFNATGVPAASRIARWNGSSWAPLGTGFNGSVSALAVLPNGDLVAAGFFTTAGGNPASRIARWNGSAWSPMGSGLNSAGATVRALVVRPSGDLLAGGQSLPFGAIARWTGAAWSSVGAEDMYSVYALAVRANGDVIAGGIFDTAGGVAASNIARWNGSAWNGLGTGLGAGASFGIPCAAIAVAPGGETMAGGGIATAGDAISNSVARWTDTGSPWVAGQPAATAVGAGQTLTLSAACASGYDFGGPVGFQWKRNGVTITNGTGGASAGGGMVSGAAGALPSPMINPTATLTITGTRASDAGSYTVVFSNGCGSVTSSPAAVTVAPLCPGDVDGNNAVGANDLTLLLLAFGSTAGPPASANWNPVADIDGNGSVGANDLTILLVNFGRACP